MCGFIACILGAGALLSFFAVLNEVDCTLGIFVYGVLFVPVALLTLFLLIRASELLEWRVKLPRVTVPPGMKAALTSHWKLGLLLSLLLFVAGFFALKN